MTQRKKTGTSYGIADSADAADAPEADPAKLEEIEAEIGQTRNAISGDLHTLGERLSPEHLKEEAKEVMVEAKNIAVGTLHEAKDVATSAFRDAKDSAVNTVTEKVDELRQNVRRAERETLGFLSQNAVPLALIGVGVAWFMSNRKTRATHWDGEYAPQGHGRWRYPEDSSSHPLEEARGGVSRLAGGARELTSHAKERAERWVDDAEHKASDVAGRVRGFAERELDHVRDVAHDAEHKLGDAAHRAREFAGRELREAREFSRHASETHPLAVGAVAVAAGLGVGLLLPVTRRETEFLGPKRERLVEGAKDAVLDWTHTAQETARNVKETLTGNPG